MQATTQKSPKTGLKSPKNRPEIPQNLVESADSKLLLHPVVDNPEEIQLVYLDLFAGAGGTTKGIEDARKDGKKVAIVAACVNHDHQAITSHALNYPHIWHFEEDVRRVNLVELRAFLERVMKHYPNARFILWASPDCTDHSNAKGGMAKDPDARMLAVTLYDYMEVLGDLVDGVQVENVEEFRSWGPMRIRCAGKVYERINGSRVQVASRLAIDDKIIEPKGKEKVHIASKLLFDYDDYRWEPISRKKGEDYMAWIEKMCSYGFHYSDRTLNAADYGAYTSRRRYFGFYARTNLPLTWPEPTHAKDPNMFEALRWKPVKEVLDLNDPGPSLFSKVNKYCDKTFARIYRGLLKHVAKGDESFLAGYYSSGANVFRVDNPVNTITPKDRYWLTQVVLLDQAYGNSKAASAEIPAATITKNPKVNPMTLQQAVSVGALHLLDKQYGTGVPQDTDVPAGTLLKNPKLRLLSIQKQVIDEKHRQFFATIYTPGRFKPAEEPINTVSTQNRLYKAKIVPLLDTTHYSNTPRSIEAPAPVITASRHRTYLINPQWGA